MTIKLANNATSRLSSPLTAGATSLSVMAGHGARFPTLGAGETFPITVVKADGTLEIMRVTARSSDVLTVVRGQENTTPQEFSPGDRVELRLTEAALDERIDDKIAPKEKLLATGYYGSEPLVTWPGMVWFDEINSLRKIRNDTNDAWITIGPLFEPLGTAAYASEQSLATGYYGSEPLVTWPGMVWADEVNGERKIRNATDDGWISLGPLFTPFGPIAHQPIDLDDLQWLGTPIGGLIALRDDWPGVVPPPTDSPYYRYVKLTASDSYNTGVLTDETVWGTAPSLGATAKINFPSSPLHELSINLINTERRFLRPGSSGAYEDSQNLSHNHVTATGFAGGHYHTGYTNATGDHTHSYSVTTGGASWLVGGGGTAIGEAITSTGSGGHHQHTLTTTTDGSHQHTVSMIAEGGPEARPRNIGINYYLRIK